MGFFKHTHNKPLSDVFIHKLQLLFEQTSRNDAAWLKGRKGFVIKNIQAFEAVVRQVFNMTLNTFTKYLKMLGFRKRTNSKGLTIYLHRQLQTHFIKQQADDFPKDQENQENIKIKSNLEEISLQFKLRSQQQAQAAKKKLKKTLADIQYKKEELLSQFKKKYQRCDDLIDNVIYTVLMGYKKGEVNEDSILNQIAQLQDLFSQNQKQLKNCMNFMNVLGEQQEIQTLKEQKNQDGQNWHPALKYNSTNFIKEPSAKQK